MNKSVIEFTCFEKDDPIEIQLEPEAIIFIAKNGKDLKFIGTSDIDDFHWAVRIDHKEKGIQLFPESLGNYSIEVYENDKLIEDWYKDMWTECRLRKTAHNIGFVQVWLDGRAIGRRI